MFLKKGTRILNDFLLQSPQWRDAFALIVFTVLITLNPYYLNNRINIYELSLYLPGINAIGHGLVPFRDFFHLRGPLELYMPAWLMGLFGTDISVLCAYFFVGNVLCLILVVLLARELVRSRYIFYMMIPAIIARTFPRVCFMNWGGMRYAFGLAAIFCLIKFLKSKQAGWILGAGVLSSLAALTSLEIGICAAFGIGLCLLAGGLSGYMPAKEAQKSLIFFIVSSMAGMAPWIIYSLQQQAFIPYLDALWTMITHFTVVINTHLASVYPGNFSESIAAMINPVSVNFKQMTPAYAYVFFLGYLMVRWQKGQWGTRELCLLSLGIYGFVMYVMAFRALLASQFEMALMPEKIIYFVLIEAGILWLWQKKVTSSKKAVLSIVLIILFLFSLGYAMARYNNRFWAFQYARDVLSKKDVSYLKYANKNEPYERLALKRAKDIWVPADQARDLNQLNDFIKQYSQTEDVLLIFPESGTYNFLFDRPFLGRFPMSDLSWLNDRWFEEYFDQFKTLKAKYVIVQKKMPEGWEKTYFGYAPSKIKYDRMKALIAQSYSKVAETQENWIYQRK